MLFSKGNAKFTPSVMRKWQAKQPKAAKLLQLWPVMNDEDKQAVGRLADVSKWPDTYLTQLTEPQAADALAELWPVLPEQAKEKLLHSLIALLLDKAKPVQEAAANLLLRLADERMISPLIVAALKDETYDITLVSKVLTN